MLYILLPANATATAETSTVATGPQILLETVAQATSEDGLESILVNAALDSEGVLSVTTSYDGLGVETPSFGLQSCPSVLVTLQLPGVDWSAVSIAPAHCLLGFTCAWRRRAI